MYIREAPLYLAHKHVSKSMAGKDNLFVRTFFKHKAFVTLVSCCGCLPFSDCLSVFHKIKPCITDEILDCCDQRRDIKKKRGELEGAKDCREINTKLRKDIKMAKDTWIEGQCQEMEACLQKRTAAIKHTS